MGRDAEHRRNGPRPALERGDQAARRCEVCSAAGHGAQRLSYAPERRLSGAREQRLSGVRSVSAHHTDEAEPRASLKAWGFSASGRPRRAACGREAKAPAAFDLRHEEVHDVLLGPRTPRLAAAAGLLQVRRGRGAALRSTPHVCAAAQVAV